MKEFLILALTIYFYYQYSPGKNFMAYYYFMDEYIKTYFTKR